MEFYGFDTPYEMLKIFKKGKFLEIGEPQLKEEDHISLYSRKENDNVVNARYILKTL